MTSADDLIACAIAFGTLLFPAVACVCFGLGLMHMLRVLA